MNDGLKARHRQRIIDLLAANPRVEKVVLFGSRAMGTHTPESDIDLALYGDRLTLDDLADLEEKIEETTNPQKVDLLLAKDIDNKRLLEHIRRHGMVWFERDKKGDGGRGMGSKRRRTTTGGRAATQGVIPGRFALSVGKPDLPTPDGWRWGKLTDVARLETGHTPSRKHPEYWDGDIPWIGIKDATSNHGRIIHDTFQHVTQLGIDNSSARILQANTVCLSRTASVGYVVVTGRPMATSQDFVNWVCSGDIDYRYLASILVSENSSFSLFSRGTTHQTIYFPEAKAFHVLLPPIKEQKEIADIIWRLNDKIELNRRQNETLEAIARAIFKSWFVDFDPVRAKQQARARGATDAEVERAAMEAISPAVKTAHATANAQKPDTDYLSHLASLFPERLVDAAQGSANVAVGTSPWTGEGRTMQEQLSKTPGATTEIGLVPEGWEVKPLGEITSQLRRGITPKYCEDGGVVVINQKCIRDGRINLAYAKRHDPSTRKIDGRQLEGGDVLINSTGVGTLGRVAVVSEDLRGLIVDTHVTVARADIRQIDIGFFDLMMLTRQSEFESMGHGSTGQTELRKDRLSVLPTIVPLLELQNEFGRYIRACFGEVRANELQAQKLSVIRNTLFPKLISGQLRIPVAETIAEEAIA